MAKKYCEYIECIMQNHEHQHHDEHTITFSGKELCTPVNILSISKNIMDGRTCLALSMENGIFSCDVVSHHNPFPTVEVADKDIDELRKFLNEMKNKENL